MPHPVTTRCYLLFDPRDGQRAYVGTAAAPERLGRPCVAASSPAGEWLAELSRLELQPLVSFEGLPMTAVSLEVAKWLAADMANVLTLRGVTVLTG